MSRITAIVVTRFRFRATIASLARFDDPISAKTDLLFRIGNISGQKFEAVFNAINLQAI
jgi:hypothetical protein